MYVYPIQIDYFLHYISLYVFVYPIQIDHLLQYISLCMFVYLTEELGRTTVWFKNSKLSESTCIERKFSFPARLGSQA